MTLAQVEALLGPDVLEDAEPQYDSPEAFRALVAKQGRH